jgi:hypothetical protein
LLKYPRNGGHAGTILLAVIILGFSSPLPESVRVKALRLGTKNLGAILSNSAVPLALWLTAVVAVVLCSQCALSITYSWEIYLIAVGNLLTFCLIFSLLLEFAGCGSVAVRSASSLSGFSFCV